MKNKIVVGNMKMYMTLTDVLEYTKKINSLKLNNVILCPTSVFATYFLNNSYEVGVQNITYVEAGAYTGEVSPLQCKSMGINYTIVGHSERRTIFKEDDTTINKKVACALQSGLNVILCVGEEKGFDAKEVISKQLKSDLTDISEFGNIIIAYEPVWAIGTNVIPTNEQIFEVVSYIKKFILSNYNVNIKVLYGGSINANNIEELNTIPNLDGYLVGKASTKVDDFLKIIEVAVKE